MKKLLPYLFILSTCYLNAQITLVDNTANIIVNNLGSVSYMSKTGLVVQTDNTSSGSSLILINGTVKLKLPYSQITTPTSTSLSNLASTVNTYIQNYNSPLLQRTSVDQAFTSATFADVTGLTANVLAGQTYQYEAWIHTTLDANFGIKIQVSGTSTVTNLIGYSEANGVVGGAFAFQRYTAYNTSFACGGSDTQTIILILGTVTINAGGTIKIQAGETAGAGSSTVLRGSTFIVTQIP